MSYNVIQIDPRLASKEAMIEILKKNAPVWGIEFTLPSLEQYIECNLDGQHLFGASGQAAIEIAAIVDLPPDGTTLAIVRPDADALGAIAILNLRKRDEKYSDRRASNGLEEHVVNEQFIQERIQLIANQDKFVQGPWVKQPREAREISEDQKIFKGLSACALDHKLPLEDRMTIIQKWIDEGSTVEFDFYVGKSLEAIDKANQESKVQEINGIAIVESRNIGATGVGYAIAPIVIVCNDAFRFQGGEPHVKYTICQWKEGYVDFDTLKVKLNEIENGWGGSKTILGSPQGISSTLTIEQVEQAVRDCKL